MTWFLPSLHSIPSLPAAIARRFCALLSSCAFCPTVAKFFVQPVVRGRFESDESEAFKAPTNEKNKLVVVSRTFHSTRSEATKDLRVVGSRGGPAAAARGPATPHARLQPSPGKNGTRLRRGGLRAAGDGVASSSCKRSLMLILGDSEEGTLLFLAPPPPRRPRPPSASARARRIL